MIIKNVLVFTEEKKFVPGQIHILQDKISKVILEDAKESAISGYTTSVGQCDVSVDEVIDGGGCYAIPGFIDMHFHGCNGYDFCDGSTEAIEKIAEYEASIGVTTIAPATMTLPKEELIRILNTAAEFGKKQSCGEYSDAYATLAGINMEGPFISKEKKGAQDEKNILECDISVYEELKAAAVGMIKVMGVAPEKENAIEFISNIKDEVTVAIAHSNADYDEAKAAIDAGVSHVVHLYNAMPELMHRSPGVVGAAADADGVSVELICDGIHVHPSVVRTTYKIFNDNSVIFISDSMRATGLSDGIYTLGGQEVKVEGNKATMVRDGAIAGSVTDLPECVRIAVKEMGIPLEMAVAAATVNPAKRLEIYDICGSVSKGKQADIVLLDKNVKVIQVIKSGKKLFGE